MVDSTAAGGRSADNTPWRIVATMDAPRGGHPIVLTKKRLLAIVSQGEIFAKIEPLFQRAPLEVHRAADGATGLILSRNVEYDLILSEFPVPRAEEDLVETLRSPGAPCESSPILLIGESDALQYAAGKGDFSVHVASPKGPPTELQQKVSGLLGISVRLASRLLVQIEVEVSDNKVLRACQTRDISISGMLLRTGQQLPVGSEVAASFYLPGDPSPLEARIRVVRHTDPMRELPGMGVQFTWLSQEDQERLQHFLNVGLSAPPELNEESEAAPRRRAGFDRFARLGD